ncbi:MAG: bifunctional phosphopantothenoylcysteine decarboxylase/phosphopantothenate--cysteine ligase CoaBC, partial [Chitinophagaceae bacterium]
MLSGKKVLICVTGSIAAYKIPLLVRQLTGAGCEVKIVMTPSATDFVSKLTLSTLSGSPVLVDLFSESAWSNHVALGRWANLLVVAPASCNSLSKMAHGQCDNLFLATFLSAVCPVLVVPAMDEDMWHHGSTKANLQLLQNYGCSIIPVEHGALASGLVGDGRMAEPSTIFQYIEKVLSEDKTLAGKKVLVTAGPTYEALDPVRFIGNYSSGKMGFALAEELADRGAQVTMICGPVSKAPMHRSNLHVMSVTTAAQMYEACMQHADYDIAIMAAAVADYTPAEVALQKLKKGSDSWTLTLKKTKDILATLGANKKDGQILVGFALETQNEKTNAFKKLQEKGADLIVLNSLNDTGA